MKTLFHKHLFSTPYIFFRRILSLMIQPVFLSMTVIGNALILAGAGAFYLAESAVNPRIQSFLDVLWWSVATATTVGYGDVSPVTTLGKWIGIGMMLFGATLFCSFTAFFASALMSGELKDVKREVKVLRHDFKEMEEEVHVDEKSLDEHLSQIEFLLGEIKGLRKGKES